MMEPMLIQCLVGFFALLTMTEGGFIREAGSNTGMYPDTSPTSLSSSSLGISIHPWGFSWWISSSWSYSSTLSSSPYTYSSSTAPPTASVTKHPRPTTPKPLPPLTSNPSSLPPLETSSPKLPPLESSSPPTDGTQWVNDMPSGDKNPEDLGLAHGNNTTNANETTTHDMDQTNATMSGLGNGVASQYEANGLYFLGPVSLVFVYVALCVT